MNQHPVPHHVTDSILRRLAALCCLLVLACALAAARQPGRTLAAPTGTIWYVNPGGNDANDCLTSQTACALITAALNKAISGDTISLAAGIYAETLNLDSYTDLTLQGDTRLTTIIDGQGLFGTVVTVNNSSVNFSRLTIKNGLADLGAGLRIFPGSVVNLTDCRITANTGQSGGGGIFNNGRLKLTNVELSSNTNLGASDYGGGLLNLGSAELINSTVINNQSLTSGGGGIGNRGALTITNSTLAGNQAGRGGAILNQASLNLYTTVISRNQATGSEGGGIYNIAVFGSFNPATIVDASSLFAENVAETSGGSVHNTLTGKLTFNGTSIISNTAGANGGGLYSAGTASLTAINLNNNRATGGSGGGLYATVLSVLTLNQGQITGNQSAVNGGGLYSAGTAVLSAVNLNDNRAPGGGGGGLFNEAQATLAQITLQNNQAVSGGGLYNAPTGRLQVTGSTLQKNKSLQATGGGINNLGTLTVTQSLLYSNTTTLQGGSGLYNNANADLSNVTFSYNTVLGATTGAILNEGGTLKILNGTLSENGAPTLARTSGNITLDNTIVANSIGGDNCANAPTSNGHNLDSGTSCGFNASGDLSNIAPLLGPLANNGGPTLTYAPQFSSDAIDGGNTASCPAVDQRGIARPQGTACDIGAMELIGYTNAVTATAAPGACITSTIVISSSYLVGTLHVGTNVTFEPRSDLRVTLYSPGNSQVRLLEDTGGAGQNLNVMWDDDSPYGPTGDESHVLFPYYEYVRVPDQTLTPLFGRSLRGMWRLEVCNESSTNTATLNRWSLVLPSINNPKVYLPLVRR